MPWAPGKAPAGLPEREAHAVAADPAAAEGFLAAANFLSADLLNE